MTVNHSAGLAKKNRREIIIKPHRNKTKQKNNRHPIKSRKEEEHGGEKYFGDLKMPAMLEGFFLLRGQKYCIIGFQRNKCEEEKNM